MSADDEDEAKKRTDAKDLLEYFVTMLQQADLRKYDQNERETISKITKEVSNWLSQNQDAPSQAFDVKRKELTDVAGKIIGRYSLTQHCEGLQDEMRKDDAEKSKDKQRNLAPADKDAIKNVTKAALDWASRSKSADCETLLSKFEEVNSSVNPLLAEEAKKDGGVTGKVIYGKDGEIIHVEYDEQQTKPRLLWDKESSVAMIELDETANDNDLVSIVEMLVRIIKRKSLIAAAVLCVQGGAHAPMLVGNMLRSGAFIIAIKSIVAVMVTAVYGKVVGPVWPLLLSGDYRLTSEDAELTLPITMAPKALAALVGGEGFGGHGVAIQLTTNYGSLAANDALMLGVVHEAHPSGARASKAAYEMAKRMTDFGGTGVRNTVDKLAPLQEHFETVIREDPRIVVIEEGGYQSGAKEGRAVFRCIAECAR